MAFDNAPSILGYQFYVQVVAIVGDDYISCVDILAGDQVYLYVSSYCDTDNYVGSILADSSWSISGVQLAGLGDSIFVRGVNSFGTTGVSG